MFELMNMGTPSCFLSWNIWNVGQHISPACLHHYYSQSNVILVDEKFTSFHQYMKYCHKSVTIVLSIPGAVL